MTDKIDNSRILADSNLHVIHFGPKWQTNPGDRPFTVAFRATGDILEVATAITHPKDNFVRKVGTRLAVEKFNNRETILIPVPKHFQRRYAYFLRVLFAV